MMAQFIQLIDQSDNKSDDIQAVFPNVIDGQPPGIHYVLNSSTDRPIQSNQQIIVTGSDQYMVIDNGVSFQNQQFDVQGGHQEIFYMDSDESHQVLLNHQISGGSSEVPTTGQKVIMVQQGQHSQPAMVIQQPAIIHKNIKTPQRLGAPVLLTQRAGGMALQQAVQRGALVQGANRLNVVRAAALRPQQQQRISSPNVVMARGVAESPVRPAMPTRVVNRVNTPRPVRAGVIQTNTPPRAGLVQTKPRQDNPKASPAGQWKASSVQINNSGKQVNRQVDGRVISAAEYNEMIAEKNKEREIAKNALQKPQQRISFNKRMAARQQALTGKSPQQPSPNTNQTPPQQKPMVQPQKPVVQTPKPVVQTPKPSPNPQFQQSPGPTFRNQQNQNVDAQKNSPTARIISMPGQENARLPAILRNFVPPPEIKEIISKTQHTPEFNDSIRMFVLLANGEQRLITFTSPKEDCTIQEILEQVGVNLQPDTKIAVSKTNSDGINLVVTVGISDDEEEEEIPVQQHPTAQQTQVAAPQPEFESVSQVPELVAPEPETPKYVAGRLAVCTHCGFLSDDFNKCIRCKSKLPDGIKSVPALTNQGKKIDLMKNKPTISIHLKNNGNAKPLPKKKQPVEKKKVVEPEPVILTLSSDEEEENEEKNGPKIDLLTRKTDTEMHEFTKKEPTMNEINRNFIDDGIPESEIGDVSTTMFCRTLRIGSYRCTPAENVMITSREVTIKVPLPKNQEVIKTIIIRRNGIAKVLVNFNKVLPIVFYYVTPKTAEYIRNELEMEEGKEPYFNPLSTEEAYRRVTLLPDTIAEENKLTFRNIYPPAILEELCTKEANNILVRTCPKEAGKQMQTRSSNVTSSSSTDVRQLLIYPPGKGGLSINTEDYLCLAQDQFLNDVIIDFYLKYLVQNMSPESQSKVHVFSTFFYKRLTTKPIKPTKKTHPTEIDPSLTPAQKRHCRVKNWTKNVNIFEKNYIIVPINENAHWFLAIICYPGMDGPHTLDNKPYKFDSINKTQKPVATMGNVTITKMENKKTPTVSCDEDNLSDKDEAEGDESELDSSEETEEPAPDTEIKLQRPPIKQPCILIFDSLSGASRSRVVATLRDYLTCEYKVKMNKEKLFSKDVIKGACPKVPQQTNYTDCGLYLLQYVESFFTTPIKDYYIPIKELKNWFEEIIVTRKREEISDLIKELMISYKKDINLLPNIIFPTLNGELVEHSPEEEDEEQMGEEEEEFMVEEPEEDEMEKCTDSENSDKSITALFCSPLKPTSESSSVNDSFIEESMENSDVKPDLKEGPSQSDRDTMSYLKAKRIMRHKQSESGDAKKIRLTQE